MKVNLKQVLLLLFVGIATLSWGRTRIRIQDKSYANIPLRVYAYENLLTHSPKLVATQTTDNEGKLTLSLPLEEGQLLYIPLYSFRLVFYAEPNKEVLLQMPNLVKLKKAFSQLKTYSNREIPLFVQETQSLNQTIANYDRRYNSFLKTNFKSIYNKKNAKKYTSEIQNLENAYDSNYFKTYTHYKKAYVNYVAGLREELLSSDFANKPITLHNTAYVSLLKKLAQTPATDFPRNPDYQELFEKFKNAKSYTTLATVANELGKTSDKKFNEHFLLYVLYSSVQQNILSRKTVSTKVQIIAKNSPFAINKELAKSIVQSYEQKFQGNPAPPFSAKATDGKIQTESIFKTKKPTLVTFFDGNLNNSENVKVLQKLQEKYKNAFNIVVFSSEKEVAKIPTNWTQFVIPYSDYVFLDYKLGRFPYFVLVEKDGKIATQTWQQYLIGLGE